MAVGEGREHCKIDFVAWHSLCLRGRVMSMSAASSSGTRDPRARAPLTAFGLMARADGFTNPARRAMLSKRSFLAFAPALRS